MPNWMIWGLVLGVVAVVLLLKVLGGRLTEEERAAIGAALAAGARVVDVRTPAEFAAGHVEGAVNVPLGELSGRAKALGKKNRPLVVYCRSGSRSGAAARMLRARGFQQVLDMKTVQNGHILRRELTAGVSGEGG